MLGFRVSGCVGLGFRIVGVVLVLSWTRAVSGLGTRGVEALSSKPDSC